MEAVKAKIMDITKIKKKLGDRFQLSENFRVEFTNPVIVCWRDGDKEMDIGFADVRIEGEEVVGEISLLPHLQDFYDAHPQYKLKFGAVAGVTANGDQMDSVIIQWIGVA